MFTAFIGILDDENTDLCIRGNGKTCSMVFYLYAYHLKGYEVWTNFHTSFSTKIIGFQEMINTLKELRKNGDNRKIVLGVTEIQDLINSIGSSVQQILFVDSFTSQMRKLKVDMLYDTQVFKNVNIRLRRHTEQRRIPFKYHLDGSPCNYDQCDKKHLIKIMSDKPFIARPIRIIKAYEVGKLYNTDEFIIDTLDLSNLPNNKKKKKEKEDKDDIPE